MNTKIIRMTQKAGLHLATEVNWMPIIDADYAERLIQIAQAEQREACAKVCDDAVKAIFELHDEIVKETARNVCVNLAKAIRAMGDE